MKAKKKLLVVDLIESYLVRVFFKTKFMSYRKSFLNLI